MISTSAGAVELFCGRVLLIGVPEGRPHKKDKFERNLRFVRRTLMKAARMIYRFESLSRIPVFNSPGPDWHNDCQFPPLFGLRIRFSDALRPSLA